MRATRLLAILQGCLLAMAVAAHAMVHAVAILWPAFGGTTWTMFVEAALLADVALLMLWAGLGPGPTWLRAVVLPLGLVALFVVDHVEHSYLEQPRTLQEAAGMGSWIDDALTAATKATAADYPAKMPHDATISQTYARAYRTVPVATVLTTVGLQLSVYLIGIVALRRCGLRFSYDSFARSPPAARFRFSLRSLLILVACAAVIAKVALTTRAASADALPVPGAPAMAFTAVPTALAVLLAVWAVSSPGGSWPRCLVLAVIAPALGAMGPLVCGRDDDVRTWMEFTALVAGNVAVTLFAVRLAGVRLLRRESTAPSTSPAPVALRTLVGSAS